MSPNKNTIQAYENSIINIFFLLVAMQDKNKDNKKKNKKRIS